MFDGSGRVPSVSELQRWIEQAWMAGFDEEVRGWKWLTVAVPARSLVLLSS